MVKGYSKTLAQEVEIEVIQCVYLGLWVILRSRTYMTLNNVNCIITKSMRAL